MFNRIVKFLPGILFCFLVACEPTGIGPDEDNTPPKAYFFISPPVGDTTMAFVLDGLSSTDAEDIQQFLEFRWDLDDDSIWDTEFSTYPFLIRHFPIPGQYRVRMEVRDRYGLSDQSEATVSTYGINGDTSLLIDPRDGQTYRIARFGKTWWMAENLNFGIMIPGTQLAAKDEIYEKYCYQNDPAIKGQVGGYYTYYDWNEVINYDTIHPQGLCPPGWRIPSRADWDSLLKPVIERGLKAYFGTGGYSELDLTYTGIHELTKIWETIDEFPCTRYWMYFTRDHQKSFYMGYGPCPFVISSWYFKLGDGYTTLIPHVNDSIRKNGGALPVRCIKTEE